MSERQCCPTCGGEGYVGGLVISDNPNVPTVDEICYRCRGRGTIDREDHRAWGAPPRGSEGTPYLSQTQNQEKP